jgi:hypothetical protein
MYVFQFTRTGNLSPSFSTRARLVEWLIDEVGPDWARFGVILTALEGLS